MYLTFTCSRRFYPKRLKVHSHIHTLTAESTIEGDSQLIARWIRFRSLAQGHLDTLLVVAGIKLETFLLHVSPLDLLSYCHPCVWPGYSYDFRLATLMVAFAAKVAYRVDNCMVAVSIPSSS